MSKKIITSGAIIAVLCIACGQPISSAETETASTPQEAPITRSAGDTNLQWGPCPDIFPSGCKIAVLHGDPAKPNADIFLEVEAGSRLTTHTHTSAERMILVAGELSVQYEGFAAQTLTPGDYAYGPAELPHKAECISDVPCTLFIAFENPVDAMQAESNFGE